MAELTISTAMTAGDYLVIYKTAEGDFLRISGTTLLTWLNSALSFPAAGRPEETKQYAAPSATAFDIAITDGDDDIRLILMPAAGYADGAITLPLSSGLRDKQRVIVNCTQAVAAFVVNGNGATVTGEPTALLADGYFTLEYDLSLNTWYRIG